MVDNWFPLNLRDDSESPCHPPDLCPHFASPLRTQHLVTQEGHSHLSRGAWDEKGNDDVNDDDNYLNALYEELDLPS